MTENYIVIFDGVCNFCNGAVNFIIKRDNKDIFKFTPMQSATGQSLIKQYDVMDVGFDTFLLIKNNRCYFRTDAALEITKELSGFWCLFRVFKLLPSPLRDFFYRSLARNRYKLFGKRESCMIPTAELKNKFLN